MKMKLNELKIIRLQRTLIGFTLATAIILLIASCYYDKEEQLYPQLNSACDTTNVRFSTKIQPILSLYCYGCHSNANAASFGNNIKLENYSDVVVNINRVYGAIMHQTGYSPMPKNGSMLSDCSRTMFAIWIRNGPAQ